jgi:hypothetical protein
LLAIGRRTIHTALRLYGQFDDKQATSAGVVARARNPVY